MPVRDAASELWDRGRDLAAAADERLLQRASDCVLAALAEALASAREPRWARAARGLAADPGVASVAAGGLRATVPDAVVANAFLVHATLSDDAYRLALHPGLAVVPTALAHAEQTGADGERVLRAVVCGYEVVCRAADALLPGISERGFRITAALAPLAAAATVAALRGAGDEEAVEALRLAAGAAGGPLRTVDAVGEAWSLQPAPAVGLGTIAARAAASGLRGATRILEAGNGVHGSLVGGAWPGIAQDEEPRILRVTFKQHPVAMYGQSIFDALADPTGLPAAPRRVDVHVSGFAAAYGQPASADGEAIASVAGITRKALADAGVGGEPEVRVIADAEMGPLDARVLLDDVERRGTGDTSGWSSAQVAAYAARRAGAGGAGLAQACAALPGAPDVGAVWHAVRAAG